LEHSACSPNAMLSDYPSLQTKQDLRCHNFKDHREVETAEIRWLPTQEAGW